MYPGEIQKRDAEMVELLCGQVLIAPETQLAAYIDALIVLRSQVSNKQRRQILFTFVQLLRKYPDVVLKCDPQFSVHARMHSAVRSVCGQCRELNDEVLPLELLEKSAGLKHEALATFIDILQSVGGQETAKVMCEIVTEDLPLFCVPDAHVAAVNCLQALWVSLPAEYGGRHVFRELGARLLACVDDPRRTVKDTRWEHCQLVLCKVIELLVDMAATTEFEVVVAKEDVEKALIPLLRGAVRETRRRSADVWAHEPGASTDERMFMLSDLIAEESVKGVGVLRAAAAAQPLMELLERRLVPRNYAMVARAIAEIGNLDAVECLLTQLRRLRQDEGQCRGVTLELLGRLLSEKLDTSDAQFVLHSALDALAGVTGRLSALQGCAMRALVHLRKVPGACVPDRWLAPQGQQPHLLAEYIKAASSLGVPV